MIAFKSRAGFSLLELLIAMLIVGIISAVVIPQLTQLRPSHERQQFISQLNALMRLAWQQAIATRSVHRIIVDTNKRTATAEKLMSGDQVKKKEAFQPIKGSYLQTSFSWSDSIEIKQFFIEGFDEMQRFAGKKTETMWFYIIPDGITQQVTINIIDKDNLVNNKPMQIGLVLNPFSAQFKVYDGFQK